MPDHGPEAPPETIPSAEKRPWARRPPQFISTDYPEPRLELSPYQVDCPAESSRGPIPVIGNPTQTPQDLERGRRSRFADLARCPGDLRPDPTSDQPMPHRAENPIEDRLTADSPGRLLLIFSSRPRAG